MSIVLMLGSGPQVLAARDWPRAAFDRILAINNAHRVRPDWDLMIHPWDFPPEALPEPRPGQALITEAAFVPAQNALGGFVYAGATMAFTAAYWALHALRPKVIAAFGCDMHYPQTGPTHFYGKGSPDPLRPDLTLHSLEAKAARLEILAAEQGCAMVNLSDGPSRLVFPRAGLADLQAALPRRFAPDAVAAARAREAELDYVTPSGRYWEELHRFDPAALRDLDALWLAAHASGSRSGDLPAAPASA